MAVQTYCVRSDIEAVMGVEGVIACIDDDQDGSESLLEASYVTACIERAAVRINGLVQYQYVLSQLVGNDYLKQVNVYLAILYLRTRRNNAPDPFIEQMVEQYMRELNEIRWGRFRIPGQLPSFDSRPTVSTFKPELKNTVNPVRVVRAESTGPEPQPGITRNTSDETGIF